MYRELRLRALAESPNAFGRTYAEESTRAEDEWSMRLAKAQDRRFDLPLVALFDGEPVALAWGRINPNHPHVAHVFQVWVEPGHRRRGIARALMEELLRWARTTSARSVQLFVTEGNVAAEALYDSLGFRAFGEPERLRAGSDLRIRAMRIVLPPHTAERSSRRRGHRSD